MAIRGTRHDDNLTGTSGDDVFIMAQRGNDTVSGGDGNDLFRFGQYLTAADHIDGGTGDDRVVLDGDYSAGLTFAADTMVNVERLQLFAGHDYTLTMNDGNVATGERLIVNAAALGNDNHLTFDGSAELDGRFLVYGGAGDDTITGGARADTFHLESQGIDTVEGGGGNDTFYLGDGLWSDDRIDGGAGTNTLHVTGFSGGDTLVLSASTLQHVSDFVIDSGSFLAVTTDDGTVAAGATMTFDASAVNTFFFDGSAETDGSFVVIGGAGEDTLTGGAGADSITGGAAADALAGGGGADVFHYGAGSDSTTAAMDTIADFDAGSDAFQLGFPVAFQFEFSSNQGAGNLDADLNNAILAWGAPSPHFGFVVDFVTSDFAGRSFLVVDSNGNGAYDAGSDLVVEITGHSGTVGAGDFI